MQNDKTGNDNKTMHNMCVCVCVCVCACLHALNLQNTNVRLWSNYTQPTSLLVPLAIRCLLWAPVQPASAMTALPTGQGAHSGVPSREWLHISDPSAFVAPSPETLCDLQWHYTTWNAACEGGREEGGGRREEEEEERGGRRRGGRGGRKEAEGGSREKGGGRGGRRREQGEGRRKRREEGGSREKGGGRGGRRKRKREQKRMHKVLTPNVYINFYVFSGLIWLLSCALRMTSLYSINDYKPSGGSQV